MELKTKIPNLSKYIPDVLSVDALYGCVSQVINITREYQMSPEEHEKKLYKSLKKKYEGTQA